MIHPDLIKNDLSPVKSDDSVEFALGLLEDNKVYHLPVFDEDEYIGLVSEGDLLDAYDHSNSVKEGSSKLIRVFISDDRHVFDAIKLFSEFKLSVLPVLDQDEKYLGYLSPYDIINGMGQMLSVESPGGILVLLLNDNDFYLSQIAQIVESNDAKILAFYITSQPNSTQLEVTLKINRTDLSPVIKSFSRYKYEVAAAYHQSNNDLDLQFRYENFIKYLNI
ncbi:MAG: CBS domain-containing protein [Schleiferiaceae bacterium]|jgi:CBS domain-containing protein|nr:CBS domain-containing protein [Schleiferiaceae bacterium]